MGKKHIVVMLDHEDGETVYCWGEAQGLETVRSCLVTHPDESVTVSTTKMTEEQYDALPDYEGDC